MRKEIAASIAAVVVGILTVLGTIFGPTIIQRFRPPKRLRWTILANRSLVSWGEDLPIKMFYEEPDGSIREVYEVALIQARLENTGAAPITKEDFSDPLVIYLSDTEGRPNTEAQILDPRVVDANPDWLAEDMKPLTATHACERKIDPLLLNPGWAGTVSVLAENNRGGTLDIRAPIVGIQVERKDVTEVTTELLSRRLYVTMLGATVIMTFLSLSSVLFRMRLSRGG